MDVYLSESLEDTQCGEIIDDTDLQHTIELQQFWLQVCIVCLTLNMGKVTIAKGSPQKRTKRNQSSSSKVPKAAKLSDAKVGSTRRRIIGKTPCPMVHRFARSWQPYRKVSKLHCDQCARREDDVPTDWPETCPTGAFTRHL